MPVVIPCEGKGCGWCKRDRKDILLVTIALVVIIWGIAQLYGDTMAYLNDGNHNYYCTGYCGWGM